jgi:hypothetical protein
MSTSRRNFLKQALAGASAAWAELHARATAAIGIKVLAGFPSAGEGAPQSEPASPSNETQYTRGIGVYPGDPEEDFSPILVEDTSTYRNLALLRPAYHSSSYDYNLTAQLVTDGIKDAHLPRWVSTSASFQGSLPKPEREFFLDHNPTSVVELRGPRPYVQVQLGGGESAPEIDRVDVLAIVRGRNVKAEDLSFTVSVSDDGRKWEKLGSVAGPKPAPVSGYPLGFAQPGQLFAPSISLARVSQSRFYRVEFGIANAPPFEFGTQWEIGEVAFFRSNQRVEVGGPYDFTSAWMSGGLGEEWVYVDLGAPCEFNRVVLYWISPAAEGSLQVSDDARSWQDIQALSGGSSLTEDIKLAQPARGRYVRVLMKRPTSPYGYILSEMEVYGRGGFVAQPRPRLPKPAQGPQRRMELHEGAWRLQRDSLVSARGETMSQVGFKDDDWIPATVPGTVLTSYFNASAVPDPNYGDNQLMISDSFFYADFWYRHEFLAPAVSKGERVWLNLDSINWKADVFLNGSKIGRIEGGFMRGRFDVTERLLAEGKNALALRVEKNDTPGSVKQKSFEDTGKNGGALGLDNPTYHASIGWDWIPTIRGRDTGIWGKVYLTLSGPVTIENPFVTTKLPLPETSTAEVTIEFDLVNHESKRVPGTLRGRFGDAQFEQRVSLEGASKEHIKLDPTTHPDLRVKNAKLWWPTGYGEQNLYDLELSFETASQELSDTKMMKAGIRQMTYSEEGGALRIWINGRRFVPRGGNWGFSESMLRYRGREYDAALRYHREMNFTMIRNWVGQVGDEEFYEACDRHGVMVWQDFWLANPWDGPDPKDNDMFLRNVKDAVLRIRNHPCIALYCGRNEGFPPKPLEEGMRKALAELHPDIHYIPNSAFGVVGGGGPYRAMPISFYFTFGSATKLHSEMGMPNIPAIESVRAMMPNKALWPQGLDWGLHDFCLQGAQGGASYLRLIEENYGGASNAEEWITLAQFVNYDGYRGMFEGQSKHRMGLLLWMSHPCWPSFVWQTYDYYLEPSAAYFGCKKASEPLHVQWNPASESVEVVNLSAGNVRGLTARVEVLNMDGSKQWEKSATLDSPEDSVHAVIPMEYPSGLTAVHFIRLTLTHDAKVVSENFYLRGAEEGNYRAIRELPKVNLRASTRIERRDKRWHLTTQLHNPSDHPAVMVRLKVVREKSGDRILPAIYSDNYVALMPGERKTFQTELAHADTRGENPRIVVEGFNTGSVTEA